ncbi:MAG: hypothetical protein HY360_26290 [Verrucomicrobia bacterium]|nr:hypothetical protein [Verrucomicrobiota bacterium]
MKGDQPKDEAENARGPPRTAKQLQNRIAGPQDQNENGGSKRHDERNKEDAGSQQESAKSFDCLNVCAHRACSMAILFGSATVGRKALPTRRAGDHGRFDARQADFRFNTLEV